MRTACLKWCSAVVVGALAGVAAAEPGPAGAQAGQPGSFVQFSQVRQVELRKLDEVAVVVRPVAVPAATVSRALSEQPVRPHMAEVRLIAQTTYIDPEVNYGAGVGRLARGHWIFKAQQAHRALTTTPSVVVVRGQEAQAQHDAAARPHMILLKPAPRPAGRDSGQPMPAVPAPPAKAGRQIALAPSGSVN